MPRKSNAKIESELACIDFQSIISAELDRRNWTKTKLARAMNCAPANVTQLLKKKDLHLSSMCAIAHALDMQLSIEYIIERNRITLNLEQRKNSKGQSHVVLYLGGNDESN